MSGTHPNAVDIPRLSNVTPEALDMRRPVIVTDALDESPAMRAWSFEMFKSRYGDDLVELSDHIDRPTVTVETTLEEYVDYIVGPTTSRLSELGGQAPLYAFGYQPFNVHPELLADVSNPYCLENYLELLSPAMRDLLSIVEGSPAGRWIFMGPKGTVSWMHTDYTAAWLAQIRGKKICALVSPEDSAYVYDGRVDPFDPNWGRHPRFVEATVHYGTMNEGDVLVMPDGWWHHVIALEASITASFNFVNRRNFGRYLEELLRDIPRICTSLSEHDALRDALDVPWEAGAFSVASRAA